MPRDFIIVTFGRVLQIAIMLVSIRVMTSILSPAEVGNYYLIISLLTFLNLVFLNPPAMYFSRNLLEWERSGNLVNAIFVLLIWTFLIAAISVPFSSLVYLTLGYEDKFPLDQLLFYIVVACIISTIHRNIVFGLNTLGRRHAFVFFLLITLAIGLLIAVYLASNDGRALSWLFGIILSEALIIFWAFRLFKGKQLLSIQRIRVTLTSFRFKEILYFTLPIGLATLLMWGQNTAYRFIVDYHYSAEILGFIAIGLSVSAAVFGAVESFVMQYFSPIFLKNIMDANRDERTLAWNNIANIAAPIYVATAIFTIALAEYLTSILLDPNFQAAYTYTTIGVGIELFRVLSNLLTKVSQSERKTKLTVMPYAVGSIITIGSLLYFDFSQAQYLIVVVMVAASILVFLYMHINMNKLLKLDYLSGVPKALVLASPLLLVKLVDMEVFTLVEVLLVVVLAGLYLLFVFWVLCKNRVKQMELS